MRPIVCAVIAVLLSSESAAAASIHPRLQEPPSADHTDVTYRPPVDRPVIDPFRNPGRPWSPGNRGLEYDTQRDDPIRAIGPGTVVFSGVIAGQRHLTVLHPDGLRSSYSFLHAIVVSTGRWVASGAVVGTAGERFHLGVRRGDRYIDPASLFESERTKPILVRRGTPSGTRWIDSRNRRDHPDPQRPSRVRGPHRRR
jgi:murein DD-endopeptidase MepM/ murein hydrolase activator NlpD